MADRIALRSGPAEAVVALRGAEPVSWRVGGRELLWNGDPAHWGYHAPNLFPVVGASAGGVVRVGGREYPMPQHGFARTSRFEPVERSDAACRLRLVDTQETRRAYPFGFRLDVTVTLTAASLRLDFAVTNAGATAMPYALGVHPAFPWPLGGDDRDGHAVLFERAERAEVPEVAPGGLLARSTRPVPLDGRRLPLAPDLFTEALVFLDAQSRSLAFEAPSGAAIELAAHGLPHLAVWSRPDAPFLSLEAWSGHADWADARGDLGGRASMRLLPPGGTGSHAATLTWRPRPSSGLARTGGAG